MNTNELFIDAHKLPRPLSKQEAYELLDKINHGDEQAKAKLVEHNIRLVLSEVNGKFNNIEYDKKELVSIGNVGLMKAIIAFDTSKKVEFSTYAIRCIDNEILGFIRKYKKYMSDDSLDRTIDFCKNGNDVKIKDTISNDTDIVEEYMETETHLIIRQIIDELPDYDRNIIILHFGFYNNRIHTQQEIANMLHISQAHVSRLIKKIITQIGKKLEEIDIIELNSEKTCKIKSKNNSKK